MLQTCWKVTGSYHHICEHMWSQANMQMYIRIYTYVRQAYIQMYDKRERERDREILLSHVPHHSIPHASWNTSPSLHRMDWWLSKGKLWFLQGDGINSVLARKQKVHGTKLLQPANKRLDVWEALRNLGYVFEALLCSGGFVGYVRRFRGDMFRAGKLMQIEHVSNNYNIQMNTCQH